MLYRSERYWRTQRSFEVFSAPRFIPTPVDQMPLKGVPQVYCCGWYRNQKPWISWPPA